MASIFSTIKRHKKISFIILVAILAGGYFVLVPTGKSVSATVYTYGTAAKGNIVQSVSGSGQVAASDQVDIKFQVAGNVTAVNAAEGRLVKSGDVLAELDAKDAQAAVDVAAANLKSAKLTMQKTSQDNSLSLTQARQSLQQANEVLAQSQSDRLKIYEQAFNTITSAFVDLPLVMSGLTDIMTGSSNIVIQSSGNYLNYYQEQTRLYGSATATLLDAGSAYAVAKSSYDNVLAEYKNANRYSDPVIISKIVDDSYDATKKISNAIKALANVIQQYQDAVTNNYGQPQAFSTAHLNNLNGYASQVNSHLVGMISTQQSIKTAAQSVESAQNAVDQKTRSLDTLKSLTNQISDQSQQLNVSQKETALADARDVLEYYIIRAPFDGVVVAANVKKGDTVSANAAAATVITKNQIAKISLNEIDVANVEVGQKATLTFDAISDLTMTGRVSEIDAIGTVSQGVVSYNVTIAFDTQNDRVRPGMSTTAAIVTKIKQDILIVPNSAIKSNAAGNYVSVPAQAVDGAASGSSENGVTVKQQTVAIGLADDNNTEIISGLNENDTVVIKTAAQASAQTSQSSSALSRMLGGGGFGGGASIRTAPAGAARSAGSSNSVNPMHAD